MSIILLKIIFPWLLLYMYVCILVYLFFGLNEKMISNKRADFQTAIMDVVGKENHGSKNTWEYGMVKLK